MCIRRSETLRIVLLDSFGHIRKVLPPAYQSSWGAIGVTNTFPAIFLIHPCSRSIRGRKKHVSPFYIVPHLILLKFRQQQKKTNLVLCTKDKLLYVYIYIYICVTVFSYVWIDFWYSWTEDIENWKSIFSNNMKMLGGCCAHSKYVEILWFFFSFFFRCCCCVVWQVNELNEIKTRTQSVAEMVLWLLNRLCECEWMRMLYIV